ncbi:hypothetical protein GGQ84_002986 [Desulfitispora alkaliphila]|uniref:YheC/YheD family protein n=1 Tax=Desulfitispora alkaliphila TaxID=622674 RepID=UPI003D195EC1
MEVEIGFICHANKDHWLENIKHVMKDISIRYNKKIVLFTINNLNLDKNIIKKAYLIDGNKAGVTKTKIPSFIYNCVTHSKPSSIKKMRQLRMLKDTQVINPVNRFYQHMLFEMIASIMRSKDKDVILPFETISKVSVKEFAKKYDSFFLLPQRSTKECRMISISKVSSYKKNQEFEIAFGYKKQIITKDSLFLEINKIIRSRNYILLKNPGTVNWGFSPLEVRGYIQKGITGEWSVADFIVKKELLSKDTLYDKETSSLADALLDLFPEKVNKIKSQIHQTAININKLLDCYIANRGSCFIDFIFDAQGNPYVVRIDGFEQDDYLYELDEGRLWKESIKNAGLYLVYLSDKE